MLSIHDFPIRFEDNCIKNCKGEILLNLSKRLQREKVIQFIIESIPAINDGKRVYKKRLTKTISDKSLKESIDIVKQEMFESGFIFTKGIGDIEYNIISKEGNKKLNFNKISINMEDNKKDVVKNLEGLLVKLLDAKTQENLTTENKETALKDLIKLLNLYWENAKKDVCKGSFNKHQEVWYTAINSANKKAKFPLLNITSGLFRCYIITLFGSIGEEDMLKELTGWSTAMLEKEKFTYDMKVLFLSINKIIKDKEEGVDVQEAEIVEESKENNAE